MNISAHFGGQTETLVGSLFPIVLFCGTSTSFVQYKKCRFAFPARPRPLRGTKERHQHDKAHALSRLRKKFTTVIILNEQQLLKRIQQGVRDQSDVELLNNKCYHEGRRVPWESGYSASGM